MELADTMSTTNLAGSIYLHSHHKCASRWGVFYFKEIARLNSLSFFHSDYTNDVAKTASELVFFGNSSYDRATEGDLSDCILSEIA